MTYRELLSAVTEKLLATGIEDAKTDAWRLFEEIGGMSRSGFFMEADSEVTPDFADKIKEAVKKRESRLPLQYITGHQNFYGCDIEVSEATLIPRFDTEVLVETALSLMKNSSEVRVLDLCTGTGCILIALGHELLQTGYRGSFVGCDISEAAVKLAEKNAVKNGLAASFFQGDLYEALAGTEYEKIEFDYILSNPPYIKSAVIPTLSPEVREHEPMAALDGGEDGLIFYRRIIEDAPLHLKRGGWIFFEIGYDQGKQVFELLKNRGFTEVSTIKDLAGLDRVVYGRLDRLPEGSR